FTMEEYELVEDILEALASSDDDSYSVYVNVIVEKLNRILRFHALALDMPEPGSAMGGFAQNEEGGLSGIFKEIVLFNPHDFELRLPSRTIFGKALIDLEISFWGFLSFGIERVFDHTEMGIGFLKSVEKHLSARVYNRMTAELLVSVATNGAVDRTIREKSVNYLARLWEDNTIHAMRNFAPLMESIWNARKEAKVVMGTMMGIQEMFDMQIHGATHYFLDFFAEHAEDEEVRGAFREFLFGATYEELAGKDRERRTKGVVTTSGMDLTSMGLRKGGDTTMREKALGIYRFFTKRKLEAQARFIAKAPGPKQTAEELLLIYFIENNL
ncbi:hypothetical protein KJ865_05575, partial [Myxococcota bacterium]|nr:hypothetical protein [Myxococcota bacterium]